MTRPWIVGNSGHLAAHNSYPVYLPEEYGAVGNGTADDATAINLAVAAAGAAGGGIVRLSKTYNIVPAIDFDFGIYTNYRVGIHVNYSNVYLVGPGTIVMRDLPALTNTKRLGIVMFGNGGGTSPTEPPLEVGTWTDNVGCIGVQFDFTEHTKAELLAISTLGGTTVGFMYVRDFACNQNVLKNAYTRGGYGSILTLVSSKFADISDNRILGCSQNAFWLDGARGITACRNKIIGEAHGVANDVAGSGFNIANNTDNDTSADDNILSENIIINAKGDSISTCGKRNTISNNVVSTKHGGGPALTVQAGDRTEDYPVEDAIITGNVFHRNAGNVYGTAVEFTGIDVGEQETAVAVTRTLFSNNVINAAWSVGVDMQAQAHDNYIINNVNKAATPIQENETATGNIIIPNY